MLAQHPIVTSRVVAAVRVAERRWNLETDAGITVMLPSKGEPDALARLEAMLTMENLFRDGVEQVDMRLPDRMTVTLDDDAAKARRKALEEAKKARALKTRTVGQPT